MAEKPNVDGQQPEGDGVLPNSQSSEGQGQAVEGNDVLLSKIGEMIDDRLKPIKGEIGGIYSRQDKDRNQFRQFMDEYNKQKGKGLSDGDAFSAAETALSEQESAAKKDKMIEEIYQKFVVGSSPQPAGNGASGAVDAHKAFLEAGIEPTKAAILANKAYNNDAEVNAAIVDYFKAQRQAPTPNAAQMAADKGNPAPSGDYSNMSADELGARLTTLIATDFRGSIAERAAIAKELERRGN